MSRYRPYYRHDPYTSDLKEEVMDKGTEVRVDSFYGKIDRMMEEDGRILYRVKGKDSEWAYVRRGHLVDVNEEAEDMKKKEDDPRPVS